MKLDTVLTGYAVPETTPIGYFESVLSPSGWENTRYLNESGDHLQPKEVGEFTDLVKSFFRELSTQAELQKYCRKRGTDTDAVTVSFRFDCALMVYLVHVTGYSAVFVPYRKESV